MNFHKNELINAVMDNYFETFNHTLDTAEFVPDKFLNKIDKYIFKNMKKALKGVDKEDRIYQRQVKKQLNSEKKIEKQKIKKEKLQKRKELNEQKKLKRKEKQKIF